MGVYLNSSFPVFQKFLVLLLSLERQKEIKRLNSASAKYRAIKPWQELALRAEVV